MSVSVEVKEAEGLALKKLIGDRHQAEFSKAHAIPGGPSMLSQHISGHRPISVESALAYAKGLGVRVRDFSPRVEGEITRICEAAAVLGPAAPALQPKVSLGVEDAANDDDFVFVRRAGVRFSNGHGTVVYGLDDMPPLSFRADFLRKIGIARGNAVVVEATGISNEPKIIDGAVVLVDTGDREHERLAGDFYAFRADGELLIKRLECLKGVGIVATAENSNFKPKMKVYRQGVDDFEVIGRARWMGVML